MNRVTPGTLTLGAAATLAGALIFAQAPPAPNPPAQAPVFRTGTLYVELDAVVTDKHDKPVKGLTQNDFQIVENGKPQAISSFKFVDIPPTHREVPDIKTTVPTIDVATNTHPPLGRQWVLVIDDLHIIPMHIVQTKRVIQDFLESLPSDDAVAIVFVGRSDLSQSFTSDLGAQLRTLSRIRDAVGFAADANNQIAPQSTMLAAEYHRIATASTDVLMNVATALAHSTYPRRALVYISEGMTYSRERLSGEPDPDTIDFFNELKRAFDTARVAGVPIYSVDPRGLPDCTSVFGDCASPPLGNIRNQQQILQELAENTGGLAFVNRSNIDGAVQELVNDNNSYYLLGYYPDPMVSDGKFHGASVKVDRPGVRIRARAGYTAPGGKATAIEAKSTLATALGAPLPIEGLALRAFAAPIAAAPHGMTTAITVEVDYPVPLDGSKIDDTLQFSVVAFDHDGKNRHVDNRAFHFTATPHGTNDVTYVIDDTIDLPSQPMTMRIGVASQALGKVGTIELPVEVPNPGDDKLQMSAVVLGRSGDTHTAAMRADALKAFIPFQPTTTRTFVPADVLRIFGHVFWGSKDAAASVTIHISGPSTSPPKTMTLAGATSAAGHRDATIDTTMPLAGLVPGQYILEIDATLPGEKAARREIGFAIH